MIFRFIPVNECPKWLKPRRAHSAIISHIFQYFKQCCKQISMARLYFVMYFVVQHCLISFDRHWDPSKANESKCQYIWVWKLQHYYLYIKQNFKANLVKLKSLLVIPWAITSIGNMKAMARGITSKILIFARFPFIFIYKRYTYKSYHTYSLYLFDQWVFLTVDTPFNALNLNDLRNTVL